MYFLLSHAVQSFQRFMDKVLRVINCFVYIDIVLIALKIEEEHLIDIEPIEFLWFTA